MHGVDLRKIEGEPQQMLNFASNQEQLIPEEGGLGQAITGEPTTTGTGSATQTPQKENFRTKLEDSESMVESDD